MGFIYSDDNKRYHTLAYYSKHVLGTKTRKAVIDAGLTCPNKDGTVGVGGCIFCDGGSGYFTGEPSIPISEQIKAEYERIHSKKTKNEYKITGYFQANTNTYCSPEKLDSMLAEATGTGLIDFLAVATRPDCIDEEKISVLKKYDKVLPLTVEMGLQSSNDTTGKIINRGYDYKTFESSMTLLKEANIRTCVHIINGLPGEKEDDMINTAKALADIKPDGVKIHLLHVIRGTKLHEMFEKGEYSPLSMEEYIGTVIKQLEILPPETVIERITGDADKRTLIAPMWSADKIRVLGTIDYEMNKKDTYQGKYYNKQ